MPIALETTPEFTPPGAQSPVCVCARSRHTQRSTKLIMASLLLRTDRSGNLRRVGCCPRGRLPIGADRRGNGHRRSSGDRNRRSSDAMQVKRPQSRVTLPKTTLPVKRNMQKFFATGVIFRKLWPVHRLRRRRTGPIRQLCETRKLGPTVCSRWVGQIPSVNFARLRKGRIWRWWPG
jgi:hypothetical protein